MRSRLYKVKWRSLFSRDSDPRLVAPVTSHTSINTGRVQSTSRWQVLPAAVVLLAHASLLTWAGWRHSPVFDEVGHLPAGISHWTLGRLDLFRVNPPLVRMVAALPALAADAKTDWMGYGKSPRHRPEFDPIGTRFLELNGDHSFWLFTMARWGCIPFSLLGGYVCWRWAGEMYGDTARFWALALWCLEPNVLGHGALITPDVGGTSLGVAASYAFWRWLRCPQWSTAFVAGLMLGLAELTKTTWIVLFVLWPALWMTWTCWSATRDSWRGRLRQAWQLSMIVALAVYLVNVGYAFEGSFSKLGDYQFVSATLTGRENPSDVAHSVGNRFRAGWMPCVPVPLPRNYVLGIDRQKLDFESRLWSTLRGEWRRGGWWYYYLYVLGVKVPVGTLTLVFLAGFLTVFRGEYRARWRDELCLLAPAVVVLTFVSSQTGFNHHLRYVLPAFPFAFIWASKVGCAVELRQWRTGALAAGLLGWAAASALWVYPHSLCYFNEFAGGPKNGIAHLGNSNTDWGQDLLYLKRWLERHPQARPLHLAREMELVDPCLAGIEAIVPLAGPESAVDSRRLTRDKLGPQPGWHAVSVNLLRGRTNEYAYFLRFKPVAMAGYSIWIYHITAHEANRVRRELGLPEIHEAKSRRVEKWESGTIEEWQSGEGEELSGG